MLPKQMPELTGKEAEDFIKYDARPFSKEEKEARARSILIYQNIRPRK